MGHWSPEMPISPLRSSSFILGKILADVHTYLMDPGLLVIMPIHPGRTQECTCYFVVKAAISFDISSKRGYHWDTTSPNPIQNTAFQTLGVI